MQKRERTMMGLPVGFQKAYDRVWYFSNYVLLAKNYLAIYSNFIQRIILPYTQTPPITLSAN